MYINELEKDTHFTLIAASGDKTREFHGTTVDVTTEKDVDTVNRLKAAYPNLNFCIASAIKEDKCIVTFDGKDITYRMIAIVDEGPMEWKDVGVVNLKLPDYGPAVVIASNRNGKPINRREGYRLFLGIPGTIGVDGAESKDSATIKDISVTGVGVIVKEAKAYKRGTAVVVEFVDEKSQKPFRLPSVVARVEQMKDGRSIVGCIQRIPSKDVVKFVYESQKKLMKT